VVRPGAGTPGGNVQFLDGSKSLGTVALDSSGRASLKVSTLARACITSGPSTPATRISAAARSRLARDIVSKGRREEDDSGDSDKDDAERSALLGIKTLFLSSTRSVSTGARPSALLFSAVDRLMARVITS